MKLHLEKTHELVEAQHSGPFRVWTGRTDRGTRVMALIARIGVRLPGSKEGAESQELLREFERELREQPSVRVGRVHFMLDPNEARDLLWALTQLREAFVAPWLGPAGIILAGRFVKLADRLQALLDSGLLLAETHERIEGDDTP